MSVVIVTQQVFEMSNLLNLLEKKTMKTFSMTVRNKSKHKFAATKVCETVEGKIIFKS